MMVEIISNEDSLVFDFSTVTSSGEGEDEVSGLEAAMQVSSILIWSDLGIAHIPSHSCRWIMIPWLYIG